MDNTVLLITTASKIPGASWEPKPYDGVVVRIRPTKPVASRTPVTVQFDRIVEVFALSAESQIRLAQPEMEDDDVGDLALITGLAAVLHAIPGWIKSRRMADTLRATVAEQINERFGNADVGTKWLEAVSSYIGSTNRTPDWRKCRELARRAWKRHDAQPETAVVTAPMPEPVPVPAPKVAPAPVPSTPEAVVRKAFRTSGNVLATAANFIADLRTLEGDPETKARIADLIEAEVICVFVGPAAVRARSAEQLLREANAAADRARDWLNEQFTMPIARRRSPRRNSGKPQHAQAAA